MGTTTSIHETGAMVRGDEISWGTTDDRLFENLDVNVGALSRPDLEIYAIELRDECRFLRIAWRGAVSRLHTTGDTSDGAKVCERYRADVAAGWMTDAR